MCDMQFAAGHFCEHNVPRYHYLFRGSRDSLQPEMCRNMSLIHNAVITQGEVFAVGY